VAIEDPRAVEETRFAPPSSAGTSRVPRQIADRAARADAAVREQSHDARSGERDPDIMRMVLVCRPVGPEQSEDVSGNRNEIPSTAL